MMEADAPVEVKFDKRIKLEHSYAVGDELVVFSDAKEEDPLTIYPQDLDSIKKEPEDEETIVIKSEPGDYDDCDPVPQNDHDFAEPLMEVVSSEPCESAERNYFLTCMDSVNGEVEVGTNTALKTAADSSDSVSKHVFLELQRMYEVANDDVKILTKKLATEKRKTSQSKSTNNVRTLKNEIKKLKEQLNSSKSKEQAFKQTLDARVQEETDVKKKNNTLRSQIEDLIKLNNDRNMYINDLKQQTQKKDELIRNLRMSLKQHTKALCQKRKQGDDGFKKLQELCTSRESQYKDMELKCALLSQKLLSTNTKLVAQQKELEKLKLDMDIMDKSIIDSVKTRQFFRDQVAQIEKELQVAKENTTLTQRLQDTQKALTCVNRRLEQVEKQLQAEKTNVSLLVKEKGLMQKEYNGKFKEVEAQKSLLQTTVTALKETVSQKMEQCRFVTEECWNLRKEMERKTGEIDRLEAEMKVKEEKMMSKECEYCGF